MGKFWGDKRWVGKSGVLENESGNISETHTDRAKDGEPIELETRQRSFQR